MTAKEYLQQVEIKDAAIDNMSRDKENLIAMLYSLGGASDGDRVQSSRDNDKFGTLYSKIDEKERQIDEKIDELIDFRLKVSEEINKLPDERYMKLLHRRYVQLLSWEMIAVELEYSYQYVISLHGDALQKFAEIHKDLLKSYEIL